MEKLKIAIQKSGRLSEECKKLFDSCGIKINTKTESLLALAENMPIEILRVRDDDIPGLVFDGVVDLGIVGENVLLETLLSIKQADSQLKYQLLRKLGFSNCRLSIATPIDSDYKSITDLQNKRIATTYPNLLQQYLDNMNITAKIYLLTGSVEVAPRSGMADAICDLVSSGTTLESNGLVEIEQILTSTACLIQQPNALAQDKQELVDKLLLRIDAVLQAKESKYIMLHCPKDKLNEIVKLLPGCEQPTILSLASEESKIALHMVSRETIFWETMEQLKSLGASSILVLPIEKMLI